MSTCEQKETTSIFDRFEGYRDDGDLHPLRAQVHAHDGGGVGGGGGDAEEEEEEEAAGCEQRVPHPHLGFGSADGKNLCMQLVCSYEVIYDVKGSVLFCKLHHRGEWGEKGGNAKFKTNHTEPLRSQITSSLNYNYTTQNTN